MNSSVFKDTPEDFLAVCEEFKLGGLVTESQNPLTHDLWVGLQGLNILTVNLSQMCSTPELLASQGLPLLKKVDLAAFASVIPSDLTGGPEGLPGPDETKGMYVQATQLTFEQLIGNIKLLSQDIHDTLEAGHNVFFVGCGATGRLSLSLEVFSHLGLLHRKYAHQIVGIHAGGDSALLRSIPEFEDKVEYGVRQLYDSGYRDGDLVVGITEGGETPFVIAACEEAEKTTTSRKPWFLYCNPTPVLCSLVARSKRVIENPRVNSLDLSVGPMAITGSTRMQATSIQQLVAGLALAHHDQPNEIQADLVEFATFMRTVDYSKFAEITIAEAQFSIELIQ